MQRKNLVLIVLFFLMSCGASRENATSWVNKVAEIEGRSRDTFNKIAERLSRQEYEIDDLLEIAAKQNKEGREELNSLEVIEHGENYKATAIQMMDVYDEFFQKKAPSLVHVLKDSVSETEVSNVMNDYDESLNKRDQLDNRLISEQKLLIMKYGLITEEEDTTSKMKVQSMNQVSDDK